jgi:predicted glutamine amidotransferase
MCRLAAFPPGFPRMEAIEILANFEDQNIDGTGSVYIKDKKFIVNKWAKPLTKVLEKEEFLTHMPYDGWTVAHLRAASHGSNLKVNTHPFIVGRWAVVHNGIWSDYNIAKLALSKFVKINGDTDSEVAANLINLVGPKKIAEELNFAGVFLALNKDGHLWAIKTSGDLEITLLKEGERVLMASEFDSDKYESTADAQNGWYHFGKEGKYIKHKKTKESYIARFYTKNPKCKWLNDDDGDTIPHIKTYPYHYVHTYGNYYTGCSREKNSMAWE